MPRCCVSDCDSGSFKEVKRTKAAGLRLKSYFTFPKNEDLLNKWKEILFHTTDKATDKLKVCEIHFCESDVIKYYETLLKDGTIYRIPRGKYALKKEAIPISMCEHKKLPIKNNIQEKNNDNNMSETISTQHQLTMTIGNQDNNESFEESESLPIRDCNDDSSTIIQETAANTSSLELQISNKFKCKEKENTQIKVYKRNHQTHNVKLSEKQSNVLNSDKRLTVTQKESENNNFIPCNEEDSDHFDEDTFEDHYGKLDNELAKHTQTVNIEMPLNKVSCTKINDNCIKDYNFLQLKNDLQSKCLNISSSWAYALEENTSVTFAYVHPLKQTIQLICIIDYNMNVKMATFNKRIVIDVSIKFNSGIEFESYLWKLEKTKCCDGTGVKNIFSDKCQGFISSAVEYKRSRGYNRCNPCREHRKWVLKKQRDRIDKHLHMREQTRKIQLLQYKYKQLQKVLSKKQRVKKKKTCT